MEVIYVDAAARGADDGTSWRDAFRDLQAALSAARRGQQVWVVQGTYRPTADGDRDRSFVLVEGVELYGGFAGGEAGLEGRDWRGRPTILSGDIGPGANSRHVVRGADDAVLDGFVIEDGCALDAPPASGEGLPLHLTPAEVLAGSDASGAGLYNYRAAPVVRNTLIRNCRAAKGAGAYNMAATPSGPGRAPVFIDVEFRGNHAQARGGGMANDLGTNPVIVNCRFEGNRCDGKGGALYNDFSCSPLLVNTVFRGNSARMAGAVGNDGTSSPLIVGCDVAGNECDDLAGGLYQGSYNANFADWANLPTVLRSRVRGNRSRTQGPPDWLNWGGSWMAVHGSEIDGWDPAWEEPELGVAYAGLIALAGAVARLGAAEIWARHGAELLSWAPLGRALELGEDRPGFGVDTPVATALEFPSRIFRVDARSDCARPDGASWATAFPDVQAAVDAASAVGGGEVWVAAGVYRPGTARASSFAMRPGVGLFGGFAGGEPERGARDWRRNPTVLSGALGGGIHAYHVVRGCAGGLLDGFVVRDGRADGRIADGFGGGLFNWGPDASPVVRNTLITDNAARDGGGVFCFGDVRAYFQNVAITHNRAWMGGGVSLRFGASVRLDDCLIEGNEARHRGGGAVVNYGSCPEFNRVAFVGNRTGGCGGAVWAADQASQYGGTEPVFRGCAFTGNRAACEGGALANFDGVLTRLESCAFGDNHGGRGNDLANTHHGRLAELDHSAIGGLDIYSEPFP